MHLPKIIIQVPDERTERISHEFVQTSRYIFFLLVHVYTFQLGNQKTSYWIANGSHNKVAYIKVKVDNH